MKKAYPFVKDRERARRWLTNDIIRAANNIRSYENLLKDQKPHSKAWTEVRESLRREIKLLDRLRELEI